MKSIFKKNVEIIDEAEIEKKELKKQKAKEAASLVGTFIGITVFGIASNVLIGRGTDMVNTLIDTKFKKN